MARILVIDDRPEVGRAISRMLYDHQTESETDPRRAIARLAAGETFEIVMVDLNMPIMSGQEVSDALARANLARPPIVLMMSSGEHVESLYATGRAVLIKPFDGDELRDLVAEMLHQPHHAHHP